MGYFVMVWHGMGYSYTVARLPVFFTGLTCQNNTPLLVSLDILEISYIYSCRWWAVFKAVQVCDAKKK